MQNSLTELAELFKDGGDKLKPSSTSNENGLTNQQQKLVESKGEDIIENNSKVLGAVLSEADISNVFSEEKDAETPKKPNETYYSNMLDFTDSYLVHMYPIDTSSAGKHTWIKNWWEFPALAGRINALWISWERAYKDKKLDSWFLRSGDPMMQSLTDKETGFMSYFIDEGKSNISETEPGVFHVDNKPTYNVLKTDNPNNKRWYNIVANKVMSISRKVKHKQALIDKRNEKRSKI